MTSVRTRLDNLTARLMRSMTFISVLLTILIGLGLMIKAWPILQQQSLWHMLSGEVWKPFKGEFGFGFLGFSYLT